MGVGGGDKLVRPRPRIPRPASTSEDSRSSEQSIDRVASRDNVTPRIRSVASDARPEAARNADNRPRPRPFAIDARRQAAAPNAGQLLKPRFPPRTGGALARPPRTGMNRTASRPKAADQAQRRRRRAAGDGGDRNDSEYAGPAWSHPGQLKQPTESVPYEPKLFTPEDMRSDWPATAISASGLTEGVQQKLEWLAKRIPHGYITHEDLAERLHKGDLVRFESEEEKTKVLRIAADLAKARAEMLTERKGEQIAPEEMEFTDVGSGEEKQQLVDTMVKGVYPELEAQKLPFLNQVVRNLRNNETYHEAETGKFMDKVLSLLPPNTAAKGASPAAQRRG